MAWYVHRHRMGRDGWVGPIRSREQADREARSWRTEGWAADVVPATTASRSEVNRWQRDADARHGRTARHGKTSYPGSLGSGRRKQRRDRFGRFA